MCPPGPPLRPSLLRAAGWLGFSLVAALLGACGDPVVGGSGGWAAPGHLVVAGSPRQMGWWQGRLLGDRIQRLVREWPERASLQAAGDPARAEALRDACRLYASHTLPLLPERLRQELEGLAAGSGVPVLTLLALEVLRDGLRWHEGEPRLLGGRLLASAEASSIAYAPEGPDAAFLAGEWIVLQRRPEGGSATAVIAWPGSLGGVAGAGVRGVAVAVAEQPAPIERQTLSGVPFLASVRLALEQADTPEAAVRALSRTTAHRVIAWRPADGAVVHGLVDHVEAALETGAPPEDASASGSEAPRIHIRWLDGRFDLAAPGVPAAGLLPGP